MESPSRRSIDSPMLRGIRRLGRGTLDALVVLGQVAMLLHATMLTLVRDRQRFSIYLRQFHVIGYESLAVVLITGVSMGLVLAVQAYSTLSQLNGESGTGIMVNYALITQLAPTVTGLMLAGRVGANIAAELGAMKVTEQIDALKTMGTDPVSYLVAPRFVACVLVAPFLTAIAACAGILLAAALVTSVWEVDPAAYWAHASQYVDTVHVLTGLGKTVIFGGIIALTACWFGLNTKGGATGVGESCTRGVVNASVLILIANFLLTLFIEEMSELLAS